MDSVSDNYEFDPSYPDPADVEAECSRATLMPEAQAWLASQGVPADAMGCVVECTSGFVRDDDLNLHFKIDACPEHALAVRTAFHIPVHHDGHFVDLIRFERRHPHAGHLRHGGRVCHGVTWLGSPLVDAAHADGWPVPTPIWRSPFGWLKSGRQGLCYLRLSWPAHRFGLLRGLPAVMAEDTEHALFLDKVVWRDDKKKRPRHWARIPNFGEMVRHATRRATVLVQPCL
jgi:hypothetical protein